MRNLIILCFLCTGLSSCKFLPSSVDDEQPFDRQLVDANVLSQQVIIRRTTHGIPHIDANNLAAAGFALGFVQMEDHAYRVSQLLLKARGEWSKYNDISQEDRAQSIDDDAANKLKYNRALTTFHQLEPDTRAFISGFTAGLNRYIALFPKEFVQWPALQFTVYDVHARNIVSPSNNSIRKFLLARALKNTEQEIIDEQDSQEELSTPQSFHLKDINIWSRLAARATEPNPDVGSNVWAFSPQRTVSGNAILMRNPHLSWDAGYYEAHINVPGKFNFYGDFRVGQAIGIIGGFNQYLGWSTTNNSPDLDEVYSFDADSQKPDHYILDGISTALDRQLISIEYKFGDGIGTQIREFYFTSHGPVILKDAGKIYVMKSAGDREFRTGEQFFKMMKAKNFEEWEAAMKMRARVSSNLTYADVRGNIFYVYNASMPNRPHPSGNDITAFHVTESKQMWQTFIDWEDLPQLKNPQGGYLRNENDTFHFTNLYEVLRPEQFESYFPEPRLRLRSQHSLELIHNDKKFSIEDVVKLKHSERMLMADRVKPDLINALEKSQATPEILDAITLLKNWNNTVAKDSRGGLLFKIWWNRYVDTADSEEVKSSSESVGYAATAEKLFKQPWSVDHPTTTPYGLADHKRAVESFEWALQEAKLKYGHWNLAWGEVHRASIDDVDLPIGGCTGLLGCYRVIWYTQHDVNKQQLKVRGGDGWVFAVEFGEIPKAYSVLAYGQSAKEYSAHKTDQLLNFTNNVMTPVAFTDKDINQHILREYRPGLN
jgi:acyl-homoserine-lactone acylase